MKQTLKLPHEAKRQATLKGLNKALKAITEYTFYSVVVAGGAYTILGMAGLN